MTLVVYDLGDGHENMRFLFISHRAPRGSEFFDKGDAVNYLTCALHVEDKGVLS